MRISLKRLPGIGIGIILLGMTACQNTLPPTVIAISKASDNYINWLRRTDSTVQYVNLYPLSLDSAMQVLNRCDGLLLTGGEDVFPGIYGKESDTSRCGDIDFYRDTLEINLVYTALEREMPILGVCRGEQLLNVVFAGELFIDIPQDFDTTVLHRCDDYLTCFHMVYVEPNSLLHNICQCDSALVTSNHHQAVRVIAPDLKANSYSSDGLVEGVELAVKEGKQFILGVQWHPERMEKENPLSGPLAEAFLMQCKIFSLK
ncbi:MAG: gamma-glutamyl-gamma-aminobutyrate hydrolase family protein [Bacteroidales bacterium]|nr:gamma-glutamyl-gamma-aminobutyrate hydrolase family protein [Bacteroidales bacterium]